MDLFIKLQQKWREIALVLAIGTIIYLVGICWAPALLDDADSVHAEAAREIAQRGDFTTLYIDGIRYLEKAPLMYWAVAAGFRWIGSYEILARLPIALATIALMLLTASLARWAFGARAGLYSGLIIGTSVGIYLFTRILIPDVMVALWLTASLYSFLRAQEQIERQENPRNWILCLYGSAAIAVLTKGLIGMVFPGAIIFLYLLITGKLRQIPKYWLVRGTLFFLIIAAPWHILAGMANENPSTGKGFFWFYFVNEHFLRYLGKRIPVDYDKVPLLLFYVLHLLWMFPWTLFAPLYRRPVRDQVDNDESLTRAANTHLMILIWPLLIILFFSFSTRQEYYTLPALPAFAIMIGRGLALAEAASSHSRLSQWLKYARISLMIFGIVGAIVAAVLLYISSDIAASNDIAGMLTRNPEYYALSLGHIFDLTPQSFSALRVPLAGAALSFLIGGGLCYWFGRQQKHLAANITIALMMSGFFVFSQQAMWVFAPYLSSKSLAVKIKESYQKGEHIIINGEYESGSSINFYTEQPVLILNNRTANLEFGSYFPDAPKVFLVTPELVEYWDGSTRVYLITDGEKLTEVTEMLGGRAMHRLAQSGGKYLLSNRP